MKKEHKKEWEKPVLRIITSTESNETVLKASGWGKYSEDDGQDK